MRSAHRVARFSSKKRHAACSPRSRQSVLQRPLAAPSGQSPNRSTAREESRTARGRPEAFASTQLAAAVQPIRAVHRVRDRKESRRVRKVVGTPNPISQLFLGLLPVFVAAASPPRAVLPPLSVGEMTLRLYGALNYSQNSARDLRCAHKWSVNAFFAKGCVHITNSKQRKHLCRRIELGVELCGNICFTPGFRLGGAAVAGAVGRLRRTNRGLEARATHESGGCAEARVKSNWA